MSREAGWAPKLLPSRGGLVGGKASDQRFELWAMAGSAELLITTQSRAS
jgi:hypothetical protein